VLLPRFFPYSSPHNSTSTLEHTTIDVIC
jgi:hypothetical protein